MPKDFGTIDFSKIKEEIEEKILDKLKGLSEEEQAELLSNWERNLDLKSHGIYGYHHSIYQDDMHLRYLLFIKSVALDNFEARVLTDMGDKNGEGSPFEKEIELLLFDM